MSDFQLLLRISPSRNEFRKKIGVDNFNSLADSILRKNYFTCQGCKLHPMNEINAHKILYLHLIEEDLEDYKNSKCTTLCKACLTTQHIDTAISSELVTLVNSTFSQVQLIEMQRINALNNNIKDENFRILKVDPKEFVLKLENKEIAKINKTKVIFTKKFEWDDYV